MTISRNLSFLAEGVSSTGVLGASNGGTGLTSLTAGYIPYGNGTSAFSSSSTLTYNGTTLSAGNFVPSSSTTPSNGMYLAGANQLGFATNSALAMQIGSTGGVSIGNTTDPGAGSLNVNNLAGIGDVAATQAQAIIAAGAASRRSVFAGNYSASCTADGIYYAYTGTTSGTGYNFARYQNATAIVYQVLGNGNVQNANNSYGSTSDIKLKENIVDATPKLSNLMNVKIRNYNFKTQPDVKQIGVVAQELETIFPLMIEEVPDRDENGKDLGTTTKSVKYSVFVPMLIKALQELKTEFDAYAASHP
jgi:hypothetical protein